MRISVVCVNMSHVTGRACQSGSGVSQSNEKEINNKSNEEQNKQKIEERRRKIANINQEIEDQQKKENEMNAAKVTAKKQKTKAVIDPGQDTGSDNACVDSKDSVQPSSSAAAAENETNEVAAAPSEVAPESIIRFSAKMLECLISMMKVQVSNHADIFPDQEQTLGQLCSALYVSETFACVLEEIKKFGISTIEKFMGVFSEIEHALEVYTQNANLKSRAELDTRKNTQLLDCVTLCENAWVFLYLQSSKPDEKERRLVWSNIIISTRDILLNQIVGSGFDVPTFQAPGDVVGRQLWNHSCMPALLMLAKFMTQHSVFMDMVKESEPTINKKQGKTGPTRNFFALAGFHGIIIELTAGTYSARPFILDKIFEPIAVDFVLTYRSALMYILRSFCGRLAQKVVQAQFSEVLNTVEQYNDEEIKEHGAVHVLSVIAVLFVIALGNFHCTLLGQNLVELVRNKAKEASLSDKGCFRKKASENIEVETALEETATTILFDFITGKEYTTDVHQELTGHLRNYFNVEQDSDVKWLEENFDETSIKGEFAKVAGALNCVLQQKRSALRAGTPDESDDESSSDDSSSDDEEESGDEDEEWGEEEEQEEGERVGGEAAEGGREGGRNAGREGENASGERNEMSDDDLPLSELNRKKKPSASTAGTVPPKKMRFNDSDPNA